MEEQYQRGFQTLTEECAKKLSGQSLSGKFRRIHAPMIQVLLGREALRQKEEILQVYKMGWGTEAGHIPFLSSQDYSSERAAKECAALLTRREAFQDYSQAEIAYFWDISGEEFETEWEMVKDPVDLGIAAIQVYRFFFIFIKQDDKNTKEMRTERLQRLLAWARETRQHLILLSNVAGSGVGNISDRDIHENYEIAATLLLILNSEENDRDRIGPFLHLKMEKTLLAGLGYMRVSKKSKEIAAITLRSILECYEGTGSQGEGGEVEEKICGKDRGYGDIFEAFLREKLLSRLPQRSEFLRYLPYTKEVEELDQGLFSRNKRGFFGLGRPKHTDVSALSQAALASLSGTKENPGFWECMFEKYYLRVLKQWQQEEKKKEALEEYFTSLLNEKLGYREMKEALAPEAKRLESTPYVSRRPLGEGGYAQETLQRPEDFFQSFALQDFRRELYGILAKALGESMEKLALYSSDFEQVLEKAKNYISTEDAPGVLKNIYGTKCTEILKKNPRILQENFRPCDLDTLMLQLEKAFDALIQSDEAYGASFQEDLKLQMSDPALVGDALEDLFEKKLSSCARIRLFGGVTDPERMEITMVSRDRDGSEELMGKLQKLGGEFFVSPRSDRIERISYFAIDPADIMW